MQKVKWGVLGVALIAARKVIPAMQQGAVSEVTAIASRDLDKARTAAGELGIPKAYGSYDELLSDPEIEAVYNPLPNHLHVPWSIAAARHGKHVLCEKPIGLSVAEARQLIEVRNETGIHIGEAFMVRTHPQWLRAREIVRSGEIGELLSIVTSFSYFNRDPDNVRNQPEWGGGALLDIGCYPIQISRYLFGREPLRVSGAIDRDPDMGIDRLTSGSLDFGSGQSVFTVGMQMAPWQRVTILGSNGRIDVEIPFNAPPDRPTRIFVEVGQEVFGVNVRTEEFPACDQYTIQGDLFSRAIRGKGEVPTPLEDSIHNMEVIEAVFRSAESGRWESPGRI
jgi:predicted dehydrogenase